MREAEKPLRQRHARNGAQHQHRRIEPEPLARVHGMKADHHARREGRAAREQSPVGQPHVKRTLGVNEHVRVLIVRW